MNVKILYEQCSACCQVVNCSLNPKWMLTLSTAACTQHDQPLLRLLPLFIATGPLWFILKCLECREGKTCNDAWHSPVQASPGIPTVKMEETMGEVGFSTSTKPTLCDPGSYTPLRREHEGLNQSLNYFLKTKQVVHFSCPKYFMNNSKLHNFNRPLQEHWTVC